MNRNHGSYTWQQKLEKKNLYVYILFPHGNLSHPLRLGRVRLFYFLIALGTCPSMAAIAVVNVFI